MRLPGGCPERQGTLGFEITGHQTTKRPNHDFNLRNTKNMKFNSNSLISALALGMVTTAASAQTLITSYTFDGAAGAGTFNPATQASGVTASKWSAQGTAGYGSGTLSATLDYVDRSGVGFAPFTQGKAATTKSWPSSELGHPALNENVYEGFTVKPNSGSLTLGDIKFDVGTGTGNDLVGSIKVEVVQNNVIQYSKTLTSTSFGNGIDFAFGPLTGTTALPIEFRFIGFNAKQNDSPLYIDNVKVYNANAVVPETSTYAAVAGMSLLGFAAFRRASRK